VGIAKALPENQRYWRVGNRELCLTAALKPYFLLINGKARLLRIKVRAIIVAFIVIK